MIKLFLKELRTEKQWSIRELSKRSGVPKSTIHAIETGIHEPTIVTYCKICTSFGINPYNDLLRKEKI